MTLNLDDRYFSLHFNFVSSLNNLLIDFRAKVLTFKSEKAKCKTRQKLRE